MTIISTTEKLLLWFSKHDSFNIDNDFKELYPLHVSETPEADKAAVIASLEELITNGALKKASISKKDYYILIRPINSFVQSLTISPITSLLVTGILREYSELTGNKDILPNPLQLSEQDILTTITILRESNKLVVEDNEENT